MATAEKAPFMLSCLFFQPGGHLMPRETRRLSPPLHWSHPPPGTRSFVLIMDDPDVPDGPLTHWVLYDIPGWVDSLPEGRPRVGTGGQNDFEHDGYEAPCPPGRGHHHYFFTLYALDVPSLNLSHNATRPEVEKAMEGHVLDTAQLMGQYREPG